jgi:hypothetical protein
MSTMLDDNEFAILRHLDGLLRTKPTRDAIDRIVARVESALQADPSAPLAWEPIPVSLYLGELPDGIQSSWVFILRGDSASGAERHPNSHQRVTAYRGVGDLQIRVGEVWESHLLTDDPQAPLLSRWASIPPYTWHQAVVSGPNWVVVSFHTASEDELIEERPDPEEVELSVRRHYVD